MKILVYRDNEGFVFGPVENKELIEKVVKEQEWFINDKPDLVKELGGYRLVGEIEGDVFYAWVQNNMAFIESNKTTLEDIKSYSKQECGITFARRPKTKTYTWWKFKFKITYR